MNKRAIIHYMVHRDHRQISLHPFLLFISAPLPLGGATILEALPGSPYQAMSHWHLPRTKTLKKLSQSSIWSIVIHMIWDVMVDWPQELTNGWKIKVFILKTITVTIITTKNNKLARLKEVLIGLSTESLLLFTLLRMNSTRAWVTKLMKS